MMWPCRAQFPHFFKAYNKYRVKGFELYALSMDKKKDWQNALDEERCTLVKYHRL